MFHHRPSSATFGGDAHHNVAVLSSRPTATTTTTSSNNENAHHFRKNVATTAKAAAALLDGSSNNATATTTSTPAKSHSSRPSRRAFGDISNKKAAAPNTGGGGGGGNGKGSSNNNNNIVLKPSFTKNAFTPRNTTNQQQFPSRIPKSNQQQQQPSFSKRTHPWSTTNKTQRSSSNPIQLQSHRQVEFILPSSATTTTTTTSTTKGCRAPEIRERVKPKTPATKLAPPVEPVDDVEFPAGRLWIQQIARTNDMEDDDDDDCASTTSLLGIQHEGEDILDRRTMWDDWKENMHRQWKEERLELELADEREVQAQLDRVIQADAQGLDSLFDSIDALRFDDADDHYDLNIDRLLEDDDWSQPASSVDGTLALTFDPCLDL